MVDEAAGLTDEQHSWASSFCGIDTKSVLDKVSSAADWTASTAESAAISVLLEGQKIAADVEAAVASGAGADAAGAGEGSSKLKNFLTDAGAVVAGAAVHAVAGAAPLGFVGAAAIDTEVAAMATPEEKFWYGAGSMAAGLADVVAGGVEVVGGILGAPETGGISLAVSIEGVNEIAGAAEAITAGAMLMSSGNAGGGGSGGGRPKPGPRRAKALRDEYKDALQKTDDTGYNAQVDEAEAKLKALDKAQDDFESCDTKDPAIMDKQKALDEAEAASKQSLEDLQSEFSARSGVLPGASKFANGRIYYNQGKGLKSIPAWTDEAGALRSIQQKEGLDSLPDLGNRTDVRGGWWKGAADHYQVFAKDGQMLDYSIIRSVVDGEEVWSWVATSH